MVACLDCGLLAVFTIFLVIYYIPDAGAVLTFGWGLYGQVSFLHY